MPSALRQRRKIDAAAQAKKERAERRCLAEKKNGKICLMPAGNRTSHPGRGRCRLHDGQQQASTVKELAEVNGMARSAYVSPGQALAGVMCLAAGQLNYISSKVAELAEDELFYAGDRMDSGNYKQVPNAWLALQREVMHDVGKFAKLAADAGIAERQTQLAEHQAAMMTKIIEGAMAELNLTPEQQAQVGPAVRRNLALVQVEAA